MSRIGSILNYIIKLGILLIVIILLVSNSNNKIIKSGNSNYNLTLDLNTMAEKIKQNIANDLYSAKATYTGYLTGYVYNCPLCGGKLGCLPSFDTSDYKNKYVDETYGEVYIVASSTRTSCGTIIRINGSRISDEAVYAIVLDRGVGGNNLDFLSSSESNAYTIGRSLVSYDVLREGW